MTVFRPWLRVIVLDVHKHNRCKYWPEPHAANSKAVNFVRGLDQIITFAKPLSRRGRGLRECDRDKRP